MLAFKYKPQKYEDIALLYQREGGAPPSAGCGAAPADPPLSPPTAAPAEPPATSARGGGREGGEDDHLLTTYY
jgi:hypothetical protein